MRVYHPPTVTHIHNKSVYIFVCVFILLRPCFWSYIHLCVAYVAFQCCCCCCYYFMLLLDFFSFFFFALFCFVVRCHPYDMYILFEQRSLSLSTPVSWHLALLHRSYCLIHVVFVIILCASCAPPLPQHGLSLPQFHALTLTPNHTSAHTHTHSFMYDLPFPLAVIWLHAIVATVAHIHLSISLLSTLDAYLLNATLRYAIYQNTKKVKLAEGAENSNGMNST